jgi:LmbE family N-acetylglucosaminyl deacetylase
MTQMRPRLPLDAVVRFWFAVHNSLWIDEQEKENPMSRQVALAVGCHPDDVEFGMAGTLSLLAKAGFEPHIHTMTNGSCGTVKCTEEEIIATRGAEAANAAALIKAVYHPGIVKDLMVYYEDPLVRKTTALIRTVKPTIVLLPSLEDYMEDHMNTARIFVTACFARGMPNFRSDPPVAPYGEDIHLYHAQPHMNRDMMCRPIVPKIVVDIESEMKLKEEMLRCHESQKHWLDFSQGQDSYLRTMWELGEDVVKIAGVKGIKYGEGWRQHSYIGYSAKPRDILSEVLGEKVKRV